MDDRKELSEHAVKAEHNKHKQLRTVSISEYLYITTLSKSYMILHAVLIRSNVPSRVIGPDWMLRVSDNYWLWCAELSNVAGFVFRTVEGAFPSIYAATCENSMGGATTLKLRLNHNYDLGCVKLECILVSDTSVRETHALQHLPFGPSLRRCFHFILPQLVHDTTAWSLDLCALSHTSWI